jgi:hypothetical protein
MMPGERAPLRCVGITGVAAWLGVEPRLVSTWLIRYGDTPGPDVVVVPGRHGDGDKAWADTPERKAEWVAWEASRPGRGARGQAKPRKAKL